MRRFPALAVPLALSLLAMPVKAAQLRVLTAGAFRPVVMALAPAFQRQTGATLSVENDTAGALERRIAGGARFDLAILPPGAVAELAEAGKVDAGGERMLARTGVGIVVADGTPRPDIATPEALRQALLAAKSVAYIDPRAGGSSGVFVQHLLQRLGIAAEMRRKTVLVDGGRVADHVASGQAQLGIHQISEILPVHGVTLVGPLPAALQSYTYYAAVPAPGGPAAAATEALIGLLASSQGAAAMTRAGLEPVF